MYKEKEIIKLLNSKDNEMLQFNSKMIEIMHLEQNKKELLENKKLSVKGKKMNIIDKNKQELRNNSVLPMRMPLKYKEYKCVMFRLWINLI
jgi:hypothetical protein